MSRYPRWAFSTRTSAFSSRWSVRTVSDRSVTRVPFRFRSATTRKYAATAITIAATAAAKPASVRAGMHDVTRDRANASRDRRSAEIPRVEPGGPIAAECSHIQCDCATEPFILRHGADGHARRTAAGNWPTGLAWMRGRARSGLAKDAR